MNSTVTRAVPLKDIDFRLAYEELYRKPYKKLKDGTYACVYLKHPFKTLQNATYNNYIDQLIAISQLLYKLLLMLLKLIRQGATSCANQDYRYINGKHKPPKR